MKNPLVQTALVVAAAVALSVGSAAPVPAADAASTAGPPPLTSYAADAFTPAERDAVVAWVMVQPAVQAHLGDSRTRLLRAGSDLPKREDGSTYRRASLFVRNYDSGRTAIIQADLDTGTITAADTDALVQPSQEEVDAAAAIIRADESLARYNQNEALVLNGAFFLRSPYRDDPCRQNVCLLFHFVDPGTTSPSRSIRRVLVDMTRGEVVGNDYDYAAIWDTEANALLDAEREVR